MKSLQRFGDWLKEGVRFPWGDLAEKGIEVVEATSDFSEDWLKTAPKIAKLENLEQLSSFFKLFEAPAVQLAVSGLPFMSVGVGLLRLYWDVTKPEPTLENSVALVAQMAYIESLGVALAKEDEGTKAKLEKVKLATVFERQLKRLDAVDSSFAEATSTLTAFPGCALSKALNDVLKSMLIELCVSPVVVSPLVAQVSRGKPQYFYVAIARLDDKVPKLKQYLNPGGRVCRRKSEFMMNRLNGCWVSSDRMKIFDWLG